MAGERLSRGDLLFLIGLLSVFGIADAAYLTWQWYEAANSTWCDISSYLSCTRVRLSPYASFAGVPTAAIALAGFAVVLLLVFLAFRGLIHLGPWRLDRWILALASAGAVFGTSLTAIEVFVIQAICILCVIGFAMGLGILGVAFALAREETSPASAP